MEEKRCSEHVYSGERWDWAGHKCANKAVYEIDGIWWCGKHRPEAVAARKAKAEAKYQAERAARDHKYAIEKADKSLVAAVRVWYANGHNTDWLLAKVIEAVEAREALG